MNEELQKIIGEITLNSDFNIDPVIIRLAKTIHYLDNQLKTIKREYHDDINMLDDYVKSVLENATEILRKK